MRRKKNHIKNLFAGKELLCPEKKKKHGLPFSLLEDFCYENLVSKVYSGECFLKYFLFINILK
jgi:hypothetical protein